MRKPMPLLIVMMVLAACQETDAPADPGAADAPDANAPDADVPDAQEPPDPGIPSDADATDADAPDEGIAPTWIADVSPETLPLSPADPAPPVELPEGINVRFAALNVYGFRLSTPEAVGEFLAGIDPDVVALSEMPGDQVDAVAAAAGLAYTASSGGKALLSATPLADVEEVPLVGGRSLLHGTTTIQGVQLSVYGVHISWNLPGTRQARQIVNEVLPADPLPHLVMLGDFNDEHYSSQNTILETLLADAFTTIGLFPGEKVTWPSTGFDETEGAQTIDMVFFRRAFPAIVVEADAPNLSPVLSDHKPVVVTLRFPTDPQAPYAADPFAAVRDPFLDFPPENERPDNLLADPGAEGGGSGWQATGGATTGGTRRNLAPRTGDAMFVGADGLPDASAPWSSWRKEVDLAPHATEIDAGRGRLLASAWMASGTDIQTDGIETTNILKTYDDGEVVLDLRDADGTLLRRAVSERRDTIGWHPFATVFDVPPGTRSAAWTWIAHNKAHSGESNDAALDDAYLGFAALDTPHRLLGGNRVADPGAEGDATDDAPRMQAGWQVLPDMRLLGPWGIAPFPPNCRSGRACWFAHALTDPDAPTRGATRLTAEADLSDLATHIDAGAVALRWGGWLRTFEARVRGMVRLEILDGDGSVWATFSTPEIAAAEWTEAVALTRLPTGARRLRLHVEATLDHDDDGVFADDLFLVPERLDTP